MKELILGGARSGKSRMAESRALATGKRCFYIATGTPGDEEMAERIKHHQDARGKQWTTIEETTHLAHAIEQLDQPDNVIVIDCLTLWISNCLASDNFAQEQEQLLALVPTLTCDVIFVSNEVGSGVVPLGQLSRRFVDMSGHLHQSLARICDSVNLVVAGLPLKLK